jgi:hypothetical protein
MLESKHLSVRADLQRHAVLITVAIVVVAAFGLACSGSPQSEPPPFQPVSTVDQLMHDVVYPHAQEVWKSVGTIVTIEGTEEIRPSNDDEWVAVHSAARTLMEAGNLLMMDGRAKDNDKWMEHCRELIDASATVLESAEAYDADAVFTQGELIYNACQNCHRDYRPKVDPEMISTQ